MSTNDDIDSIVPMDELLASAGSMLPAALVELTPPEEEIPPAVAPPAEIQLELPGLEAAPVIPAAPPLEPNPEQRVYMIPKPRLDQETKLRREAEDKFRQADARARELENRMRDLETRAVADAPLTLPAIDPALMAKYHDAILDNQPAEAAAIMAQIQASSAGAIAAAAATRARQEAVQEIRAEQTAIVMDRTVQEINAEFPLFDPDSPEFDQAAVNRTLDMFQYYGAKGLQPRDALLQAAAETLHLHYPDKLWAMAPVAQEPAPALAAPQPFNLVGIQRQQQQTNRVQQLATQPVAVPARAAIAPSQQLDVANMSDEEFAALPVSKLRELRGDFNLGRF